jgi:hypothetical protein
MNPTLAQLAHEAGITVTAESAKFAKLIVKECMDICKKHSSRDLDNGWFADAVAPHLVQLFEEHFGVEE